MRAPVVVSKSAIAGKGLYAAASIKKGAVIMRMSGTRVSEQQVDQLLATKKVRRDNPLQVGQHSYMILDSVPVAANHSCAPNAAVTKTNTLIALKAIKKGDEITFDYACTVGRGNEGWTMRCKCSTDMCRTTIGAWTTLPKAQLNYYKRTGALPTFVLKEQ
jgi:SET domain-containing protein